MTDKRHLERLKNILKIRDVANQVLDVEIEIDELEVEKQKIIHDLSENRLIIDEIRNKDFKNLESLSSIVQTEVDHPSKKVVELEEEISKKEKKFFRLHQIMKDEVRSGLTEMFHEAMLEHDHIEKNLFKIKKMTMESQKVFQDKKTLESRKRWIEYVSRLMVEEERLKENEEEIDDIKRVLRIECDDE